MAVTDELIPVLKKLRLSGVLHTFDLRRKEAVDESLDYAEFLYRLCQDEVERRESKQLELRLRRASFETTKRLEDFDFRFNPQIPKSKIIDLATAHFVKGRENILLALSGRRVSERATSRKHWESELVVPVRPPSTSRPTECCPLSGRHVRTKPTTRSSCATHPPTCSSSTTSVCDPSNGMSRSTSTRSSDSATNADR